MQIETARTYPDMRQFNGGAQGPGNWTDDRVAALKKLWLDGKSASECARALRGGATRCSVIGKVHRMGLPTRGRTGVANGGRTTTRVKVEPKARLTYGIVASEKTELPVEDVASAKPYAARSFGRECAWPVGHEMACCAPVARGQYCADHAERAFLKRKLRTGGLGGLGSQAGNPDRWFG